MYKSKFFVLLLTLTTLIFVPVFKAESDSETQDQELITTVTADNKTITLAVPRRSISPSQVAILANLQDVQSVNAASYYAQLRNIPVENIIYLNFPPAQKFIRAADFNKLKQQVETDVAKLPDIQAYAITWTEPWAVYNDKMNRGMGITSAFTLGFAGKYYNDQSSYTCKTTVSTPLFNSNSNRPYSDYGIRPSMMLAGIDFTYVKDLMDRGKKSDATFPGARGYFIRTNDYTRSFPRYPTFIDTVNMWDRPDGIAMTYIDNSQNKSSNYLLNKPDVLFYFTGLANVPQLTTNQYVPGGVGDHLTSYGGLLTQSMGQTSSLRFLEAGLTGSYGTMEEPCAFDAKFPDTFVFTRHYFMGSSLLQSYWSSVEWPGEGVFVGDPLARPFGTKINVDPAGQLTIKTSILRTKRIYSLLAGDNANGPFSTVISGITLKDLPGIQTIQTPLTKSYYVLKEDVDPALPLAVTDNGLGKAYPVTNGKQVVWYQYSSQYPLEGLYLMMYDQQTKTTKTLAGPLAASMAGLTLEGTTLVYKDLLNNKEVLQVMDTVSGTGKTIQPSISGTIYFSILNKGRVFWSDSTGIHIYDLAKDSVTTVTPDRLNYSFGIDGDILAWISGTDGTMKINILNLATGARDLVDLPGPDLRFNLLVRGSTVYWLDFYNPVHQYKAMSYDTAARKIQTVLNITSDNEDFFDINSAWMIWLEQIAGNTKTNIYVHNNLLGTTQKLKAAPEDLAAQVRYRGVSSYNLSGDQLAWINNSAIDGQSDVSLINLYAIDHAAYWKLDEAGGTTAADSANGNTAVLVNNPSWVSGKVNGAVGFDGFKSYLQVADSGTLALGKDGADFSLAFWINIRQTPGLKTTSVFYKGHSSTSEYTPSMFLTPWTNNIQYCASTTKSANACGLSSDQLPSNRWVHVAYVKEGSSLKLYLNGKFDSSLALTGTVIANKGPLYFGKDPGRAGTNCAMDDIRILNRALTAGELESLAGVNGGVAPYITVSPRLVNATSLGQVITLSVKANGTGALQYQWKKNGVNIPGANARVYTTPPVKMSDSGSVYNVVITNSAGSVTSNPAIVIILKVRWLPPPAPVPYPGIEVR